jgi:hypothetical protein
MKIQTEKDSYLQNLLFNFKYTIGRVIRNIDDYQKQSHPNKEQNIITRRGNKSIVTGRIYST